MFFIKLAGWIVAVDNRYPEVEQFCFPYWINKEEADPVVETIRVTQERLERSKIIFAGKNSGKLTMARQSGIPCSTVSIRCFRFTAVSGYMPVWWRWTGWRMPFLLRLAGERPHTRGCG